MIPVVLAGLLGAGVAGVLALGVLNAFRRRPHNIEDYPELPSPDAFEVMKVGERNTDTMSA